MLKLQKNHISQWCDTFAQASTSCSSVILRATLRGHPAINSLPSFHLPVRLRLLSLFKSGWEVWVLAQVRASSKRVYKVINACLIIVNTWNGSCQTLSGFHITFDSWMIGTTELILSPIRKLYVVNVLIVSLLDNGFCVASKGSNASKRHTKDLRLLWIIIVQDGVQQTVVTRGELVKAWSWFSREILINLTSVSKIDSNKSTNNNKYQ